jgi:copper homeostasis protein
MLLEICAPSLTSALAAQAGGAQRIELCAALEIGGITPSPATLRLAREQLHIQICVLVRPRGGDFCYNEAEFETIKQDILYCKTLGMDGVVVGALNPNGTFDLERMKILADLARPMQVVSHRAFDQTPNPYEAMEQLIALGYDRILTSGQAKNVVEGTPILKELIQKAAGRITIMPGNGVSLENVALLLHETGATEIHTSAKKNITSPMQHQSNTSFNVGSIRENDYQETDVETVKGYIKNLGERASF